MVDRTEQRIYELIKPWCGRSWLTRRTPELSDETSLNMTLNMDPEDTAELLVTLFNEFVSILMILLSIFTTLARMEKKLR
ncbi:hypothetical protein QLY67_019915 [Cronobacter turicensis]|uniref:hypothetical protein n=1 Tax=Cronobacter turicensis TaxID=413502 RepID=UPI0024AEBC65|nr:hypothetical protein [Cronobacter turicensis]MDI7405131.1 hypothetical protein [Cronobacter turicensis]